jgi:hypothetical protein
MWLKEHCKHSFLFAFTDLHGRHRHFGYTIIIVGSIGALMALVLLVIVVYRYRVRHKQMYGGKYKRLPS